MKTNNEIFMAQYEDLLAKGTPIETTPDNIATVLHYLSTRNWGSWQPPAMTIGYTANQYDCNGRTAVTMTLDKEIEYAGEKTNKFVYNAPRGSLTKYTRVR